MGRPRAAVLLLVLALTELLALGVSTVASNAGPPEEVVSRMLASHALVAAAGLGVGIAAFVWLAPAAPVPKPEQRTMSQQEALARQARKKAEFQRRAEMLQGFLARLSMELRTSLTAVIGYAELVREEAQRERRWTAASDVDRVLVGARSGLDLVEDTLALTALERGDSEVDPRAFQLGTVLHAVISRLRPLGASLGTRIELDADDAGSVFTDRGRLQHVLRNVIARGVHAAPGGAVRVRLIREGAAEAPWIRVEVSDDGPLLAPGQLDEIFAVEATHAQAASGPGSSIGLVVARRFAQSLGGELSAGANAEAGTVLTLRFPARLAPRASEELA